MKVESKKLRMERKNKHRLLRLSLIAGIFISFGWIIFGYTGHALADTNVPIGNVEPLPGSADIYVDPNSNVPSPNPVSTTGWPALEVGDGPFNANYLWLKVYVPLGTDATVTIQNGAGFCKGITNDLYDASSNQADVKYSLKDSDANEAELASGATYNQTMDSFSGGSTCGDLSFPTITAAQGTQSQIKGHEGYRVFLFMAHVTNCPDSDPGCIDANKSFRVYVNSGASTAFSFSTNGPLVGFSRTTNSSEPVDRPFGISYAALSQIYGNSVDFTYNFQFGLNCSDSSSVSAPIAFYNMDNGLFSPQFLSSDLSQNDKSQAVPNWVHVPPSPTYTGARIGAGSGLDTVYFNAETQNSYKLYVNRVNWNNAMQFYVPYDQFDAQSNIVNCDNSACTYAIDGIPPPAVPPPRSINNPYSVTINMQNTGTSGQVWNPHGYVLATMVGGSVTYDWTSPGGAVTPGSTAVFTFPLDSSIAGTYPYTFQMQGPAGTFGQQCTFSLQWTGSGPPPSSTTVARLGGAQVLIDVTGEGNDVLKRLSARVPLDSNTIPDYTLQSMDTICKLFKIPTDRTSAILDDPAGNIDNACVGG